MSRYEAYLAERRQAHLEQLLDFLRIPSVSALPAHKEDVRRAAQWAADHLRSIGVPTVEIWETGGHPAVYGEWIVDPEKPTHLIYGHVDVQPVDPVHLWETPPFEPVVRDGRIFARGASDDKGCAFIPLKAVEALIAVDGRPPVNLKFLLEGEEEIGSPNLPKLLRQQAARLRADAVLCADGGFYKPQKPGITVGSRGLCAMQIDVRGAKGDLHSGGYGGAIQNPIHALAAIIASMRSPDGKILVKGFYDGVRELTGEERVDIARVPFDERAFLDGIEVSEPFGEPGYSTLERLWARPTLEVNGIWGGFQGEGTKTVLPSEAHAKITCRLVPEQDPNQVLDALEAHIRAHTPPGVTVKITRHPGSAAAYLMSRDHPIIAKATQALREVYGEEPVFTRTGGTLPVAAMVKSILKTDFIFFSFGDPDNQIHAPNEFFRLESFDKGVRSYIRLLAGLGG
ncbi:MAG: dipeptidase [Firmicutes bacterium]|nr:dipeptidase [Bacillota bacterium]